MTLYQIPVQTANEAHAREAFQALMWSMGYPGRSHELPTSDNDFVTIARSLLDLETSYFCADPALDAHLAGTGACRKSIEYAAYVFIPHPTVESLELIQQVNVGTFEYPDEGATIFIGATFDAGPISTWRGPGISSARRVCLDGVPAEFWAIREQHTRYPLGFDVYFVDRGRVLGLPRTAQVMQAEVA